MVALTSAGGNLFSVNGLVGSYRSQCDSNAYYNAETEICEACSGSCSSCANSQDDCFSCNPKYYLNGRVCSQCVSPCLECTSSTVCTSCMKPFEFKNKECVCGAGEYINGEKCSSCIIHCASCNNGKTCLVCKSHYSIKNGLCVYDGTPTWLIILLAATAILVVAVIGGTCPLILSVRGEEGEGPQGHPPAGRQRRLTRMILPLLFPLVDIIA